MLILVYLAEPLFKDHDYRNNAIWTSDVIINKLFISKNTYVHILKLTVTK